MLLPKISVVMSTYNEKEVFLRQAIESILSQTYSDFEFLIGMDNPENESIKQVLREYERCDERIKVVINEQNIGLARTLNKLISMASGEIIARMDADDRSEPDRLEKQLCYMYDNGADIISCDVLVIDEDNHVLQEMKNLPSTDKKVKRILKYNNCVPHPGWLVKKNVYSVLGGYNETPYCEDYEFLLRARNKGFRFGNVNEMLINYRMTGISISRSNLYKQYLAMKCCQKKYIEKKDIVFKDYLEENYDSSEEQRYIVSAAKFSDGLLKAQNHKYFQALGLIWSAYWGSECYRDKMWKYLRQVL